MSSHHQTAVTDIALTSFEGEPRARDLDLAERLGFKRPRVIRELIDRNMAELESFGAVQRGVKTVVSGRGRKSEVTEFWLNEEQALLVAVLSEAPRAPAVRHMLIKVFVAWRRGHLEAVTLPPELTDMLRRTDGIARMLSHKVTGIEKALNDLAIADGLTAGEVCDLAKVAVTYPRGVSGRVSRRLAAYCRRMNETPRVQRLGRVRAQLFPAHLVREWLDLEGRSLIKMWITERQSQGRLKLVPRE